MLSEKMWKALNEQVKWELQSSYMYLGMAAWLNDQSLPGFAHWMRAQAVEENEHAMKVYKYIEERGNRVELLDIPAPAKTWADVNDVMNKAYQHEQFVTGLFYKLTDTAMEEKDHATFGFLQWFIKEQVEEEDSFRSVIDKLGFLKSSTSGLLFLDKQMGHRGKD